MSDLVREYFERDFTDSEKDSLGATLKGSESDALRFLDLASEAYRKTGLPEPKAPKVSLKSSGPRTPAAPPRESRPLRIPWGKIQSFLTLLFILAGALLVWKGPEIFGEKMTAPALVLPDEKTFPKAPPKVKAAAPARPAPSFVTPERYVSGKTYSGWLAVVEKPVRGAAKVRVTDAKGRLVRRLFEGTLEKGNWVFRWDGHAENGRASSPGKYAIEVLSNGRVARRVVQIAP